MRCSNFFPSAGGDTLMTESNSHLRFSSLLPVALSIYSPYFSLARAELSRFPLSFCMLSTRPEVPTLSKTIPLTDACVAAQWSTCCSVP